ncbi:DUF58 domain-containing protein [Aureispira anguillae]|uniref:DUF58 domain-containing protein n=1 Tax=Aureispira anguillae TaxID=2864201 RepID=A0A916DVV3_9BACT|nr:DUF58 domain-containing protein [Aureispira anguillae]BDS14781.1 DUF58 domain-containing protein [Aureispira anguillae]
MTIKELLKKVRKIEIKTRGLSNQVFSGTYKTRFKGRGMSFSEVRQYQYGDDVRNIDWNVTARTNEPYVKVFEEERELTFMLLIDVSGSAFFGTTYQNKMEIATEIAATLAFSASANNDKVGAIFFSDKVENFIPPKKGKAHILRILRDMIYAKPSQAKTNLNEPLKYLTNIISKRCTAFVLSDFMCQDYNNAIKLAANRHDTIGIHIYDPLEVEMPNVGLLPMIDAETGQTNWVDTSSEAVRNNYNNWYHNNLDYFKKTFLRNNADVMSVATNQPYLSILIKFFKERRS